MDNIIKMVINLAIGFYFGRQWNKASELTLEHKLHNFLFKERERLEKEYRGAFDKEKSTPGHEKVYEMLNAANKMGYSSAFVDLHDSIFSYFKKRRNK